MISELAFKVVLHSGETGTLVDILQKNANLITPHILKKYLLEDPKKTFNFLLHNNPKVREFASIYL